MNALTRAVAACGLLTLALVPATPAQAAKGCGQATLSSLSTIVNSTYQTFQGADALGPGNQTFAGRSVTASSDDAMLVRRWNGSTLVTEQVDQTSTSAGAELNDVTVLSHGRGWAAGTAYRKTGPYSALIRTRSAQGVWKRTPLPDLARNSSLEGAIDASSGDNVWAVGRQRGYKEPLVLRWNGKAWKEIPVPAIKGADEYAAWGVDAIGPRNVWIAATYLKNGVNVAAALHWNGSRYVRTNLPLAGSSGNYPNGIAVRGANDIWVGGTKSSGALYTTAFWHFDGAAWSVVVSPNGTGTDDNFINDLTVAGGRVYATGYYYAPGDTKMLAITSNRDGQLLSLVAPTGQSGALLSTGTAEGTNVAAVGGTKGSGDATAWSNCA